MVTRLSHTGFVLWFVLTGAAAGEQAWTIEKRHVEANRTGMQFGFWANYDHIPDALRDFGRSPIARVGFTKWAMIEKTEGQYNWGHHFNLYQLAHRCGSSVVANVNVCFSHEVNPKATHATPSFYPPRISDPKTRRAAERFLHAYVQELLRRVGDVVLVLDYEIMWHYLPRTPAIRQEYRD